MIVIDNMGHNHFSSEMLIQLISYLHLGVFLLYHLWHFIEEVFIDCHLLSFRGYFLQHEVKLLLLFVSDHIGFCMVFNDHFHCFLNMMQGTQEIIDGQTVVFIFALVILEVGYVEGCGHEVHDNLD